MGRASRIFEWVLVATLVAVFLFAGANASDRSPYQWSSTFVCMFSWMFLGPLWLLLFLVRRRHERRDAAARGFEVKPPSSNSQTAQRGHDTETHPD